jgi:hypothetical protein
MNLPLKTTTEKFVDRTGRRCTRLWYTKGLTQMFKIVDTEDPPTRERIPLLYVDDGSSSPTEPVFGRHAGTEILT